MQRNPGCGALALQGYAGHEDEVVDAIVKFITISPPILEDPTDRKFK